MMRVAGTVFAFVALLGVLLANAQAADKEVTLKGKIVCGKCGLKQTKKCSNAIQVKEDGKEVVYFLLDNGNKEDYHEMICGSEGKEGTVTGVVSEKDGKKWIKPSKVEYTKK
jgi:hypothetical protein